MRENKIISGKGAKKKGTTYLAINSSDYILVKILLKMPKRCQVEQLLFSIVQFARNLFLGCIDSILCNFEVLYANHPLNTRCRYKN